MSQTDDLTELLPPIILLEQCQDVEIFGEDDGYFSKQIEGASSIKSVTLNWAEYSCACEFGQTYGFDRNRVFVDYGCGGSFRVCYQPEISEYSRPNG